jgi:hypothetical protein
MTTSRHIERMAEWCLAAVHKLRALDEQDQTTTWSGEEFARKIGLLGPQAGYGQWHVDKILFILEIVAAMARNNGQTLPTHRVIVASIKPVANTATVATTSTATSPPPP